LFTLSGCSSKEDYVYSDVESIVDDLEGELGEVIEEQKDTDVSEESSPSENIEIIENTEESIVDGELEVHFIDVGQGDSILIKQNGHNMLIDAGDNKYGQTVVNYLKENGVKKLDYVIGTHPHADHIGGLDDVIYAFDVEKVFLPNITHTTKTFEDLLIAIQSKNLNITVPEVGGVYSR
jgi:competence protein ComEC